MSRDSTCPECGASDQDGLACRQQWEALLGLEFSDARTWPAHFLTVACYRLQHPQTFGLTEAAREQLWRALANVVEQGQSVDEARRAMQRTFDGATRVRAKAVTPVARVAWSRTVADVYPPEPMAHVERVWAWARSMLAREGGGK